MLEVQSVDWHLLENGRAHHTDRYEILHEEATPVLRRAQPFKITLTFRNRPFNEATDRVRLLFLYGSKKIFPRIQFLIENTTVSSYNKIDDSFHLWSVEVLHIKGNCVTLLVRSPPAAAWGLWNLTVKTSLITTPRTNQWKSSSAFLLIYNPWNKDDEVYMDDTRLLDEYILNDVGKIYTTSSSKPIGMKWIFGQFTASVTKVVVRLLADSLLIEEELASPVRLLEFLARNVSTVGDLVLGDWSGDYSEGTAPWLWSGSPPIFQKYLETGRSVKYGQCFTYSGLFTTALRAVGIPARSVTNFVSATGAYNLCINDLYNTQGELTSSVFIWNFHCWNEAWSARDDLPAGYGGWQAVDASNSDGPASVRAIKEGEIHYPDGTRGFLGEINADRIRWTVDENEDYHIVKVDTKYTGRALLTKLPFVYDPHGDTDFQDVLSNYKEPEGSEEERMSMYNAIKHCKILDAKNDVNYMGAIPYHVAVATVNEDIVCSIQELDYVTLDQPLQAYVSIQNEGAERLTVDVWLCLSTTFYNGSTAAFIKKQFHTTTIAPFSSEKIWLTTPAEDVASGLVEFNTARLTCLATVRESRFSWADERRFTIQTPDILIFAKDEVRANVESSVCIRVLNPLRTRLTDCRLFYETAAPASGGNFAFQDIEALEEAEMVHKLRVRSVGEVALRVVFHSTQLRFLSGSTLLDVAP